ncbi:MAG: cell division protein, partial [Rhodospirillaceae bacterium]
MAVFKIRSDLPLRGDNASRFVFSLVTVLVFLAALAVTASVYLNAVLADWNQSVTGTLTVQIPASEGVEAASRTATEVVQSLLNQEAVTAAAIVSRDKIEALLEPWLGDGEIVGDLPLPVLIDVQLADGGDDSAGTVTEAVMELAPTAVVENHRLWLNRIASLAEGLNAIALVVMALVTGALALTVIFATRASLTE